MVYDVDDLSTAAYRIMAAADDRPLTAPIIKSRDFPAMQELLGEGLAQDLMPCSGGYQASLTEEGTLALYEGIRADLPALPDAIIVSPVFTQGASDADLSRSNLPSAGNRAGLDGGSKPRRSARTASR